MTGPIPAMGDQFIVLGEWSYARVLPNDEVVEELPIGPPRGVGRILADVGNDVIEDRNANRIALDAFDHVYRHHIRALTCASDERATIHFPAIATIASVFWNGQEIARSSNSFLPLTVDITERLTDGGTLEVRCASLQAFLDESRRPRPRFKTKLVADQRLRHVRASLLGRIPSWSPPVPFVGLAGPISIHIARSVRITNASVRTTLHAANATLQVTLDIEELGDVRVTDVSVRCADWSTAAELERHDEKSQSTAGGREADGPQARRQRFVRIRSVSQADNLQPWWPHTHGPPKQYLVDVVVTLETGEQLRFSLGQTGFRCIEVDRGHDGLGFALRVNGTEVFCRGSAWMPIDQRDPWVSPDALRIALMQIRDTGANMLRLTGVSGWEQPAFYSLCDELGLLVWQDLPFATLDQPTDQTFIESVREEVRVNLNTIAASPCLAVVCGATERQQQAAMLGLDHTTVTDAVGSHILAQVAAEVGLTAVVVPCSPSGGHLPFASDAGVSHYYGVGAYLRPLTDARHAGVRFTTECLAFANVPEPAVLQRLLLEGETPPTDPRWKERVPRDRGVGWDFDDVRDHYLPMVTGEDPHQLRRRDVERYLELSRIVPAIVASAAMHEWRRPTSSCAGAITWFLRDLWRGAGWGLIDSDGEAKAVLHSLAQAWSPISVGLVDEGLNGVDVWVHNDRPTSFSGAVHVTRTERGRIMGAPSSAAVQVPAHSSIRLRADEIDGRFTDPTNAYLFGPSAHDAISVRLVGTDSSAHQFETGNDDTISRYVLDVGNGRSLQRTDLELCAHTSWIDDGTLAVDVSSPGLARLVRVESDTLLSARHHVDITPGEQRRFYLTRRDARPWPSAVHFAAVNARTSLRVPITPLAAIEPLAAIAHADPDPGGRP